MDSEVTLTLDVNLDVRHLSLTLPQEAWTMLERLAKEQGKNGPHALVRSWIEEKLKESYVDRRTETTDATTDG